MAMPPMPAPRDEPRLEAAELIDIIVPRNSGICSKVRLSEAEYLIPAITQHRRAKKSDSQKIPKFRNMIVIIPSKNVDNIVKFFLP